MKLNLTWLIAGCLACAATLVGVTETAVGANPRSRSSMTLSAAMPE